MFGMTEVLALAVAKERARNATVDHDPLGAWCRYECGTVKRHG